VRVSIAIRFRSPLHFVAWTSSCEVLWLHAWLHHRILSRCRLSLNPKPSQTKQTCRSLEFSLNQTTQACRSLEFSLNPKPSDIACCCGGMPRLLSHVLSYVRSHVHPPTSDNITAARQHGRPRPRAYAKAISCRDDVTVLLTSGAQCAEAPACATLSVTRGERLGSRD
jgi:hypothetical protein